MTPSSRNVVLLSTLAVLLSLAGSPAQSQALVKPQPPPALAAADAVIALPVDRKTTQMLEAVADLIANQNWKEVAPMLQGILDAKEDSFAKITKDAPGGKQVTLYVSAQAEASRLLHTLPDGGKAEYQKQFAEAAATRLAQAKQLADPTLLADVVQRYLYTPSGPEAATLLGMHYLSRDEPLMASLYFDRAFQRVPAEQSPPLTLYRAAMAFTRTGDKQRGEALWLLAAGKLQKDGGLTIGGKLVPLKNLREELDRAGQVKPSSDWPMFRGGPGRTEQGKGGAAFLEPTWTQTTLCETRKDVRTWTEDNLNASVRWLDQRGLPVLSAFFPITSGDKVIYRTYDAVYALDLRKEGKLEWFNETDGGLFSLLNDPARKGHLEQWKQMYQQNGPFGLLFENSVTGTLSTDGVRVFAVDDLAILPHPAMIRNFAFGPQPNFGPLNDQVNSNSLKAYNLETGKLVWELGGKYDKDDPARGQKASELAGSIFLGPPLPLGGKLYVLFEKDNVLRLACLEARDKPVGIPDPPKVHWTQTIALVKDKISFDLLRRTQAAPIASGNGVLVCPTNAGMVVGIDLVSHQLRWMYTYVEQPPPNVPRLNRPVFMQQQFNLTTEWRVAAPAVSEGKVVFTAPDSTAIHCIDIRDGSLIWKAVRAADDLYFAGIVGGRVVIVGKSNVKALDLATGKTAWEIANVGAPSGQGVASEGVYYLPLKAGPDKEPEICAINVAQGKIVARTKSRKKETSGNLLFAGDEVISQTLTAINGYPTIKAKLNPKGSEK